MPARHIVLTGPMGVGKSTTAAALLEIADAPLRDSDVDIERLFAMTGAAIAERHGVDELHRLEAAVLLGALAGETATVITAGSSVIDDARCREAMARRARVVFLDASDEALESRRGTGEHRRAVDRDAHRAIVERRRPLFRAAADLCLDAQDDPSVLAAAIAAAFGSSLDRRSPVGSGP